MMVVFSTMILRFRILLLVLFVLGFSLNTGCAYKKLKPWHRDVLAQEKAQLVPDILEIEADNHIYFSKEAASGGEGFGGGGCGCN